MRRLDRRGRAARVTTGAGAVAVIGVTVLLLYRPQASPGLGLTLPPTADTYVGSDKPRTQHGYAQVLRIDADHQLTLLRFDLPDDRRPVQSATLRLRATSRNVAGAVLHVVDGEWDEMLVTWDSRPDLGAPVALVPPNREPGWVEADVTRAVQPGEPLMLALSARSTTKVVFSSRETADGAPTLVVRYG
jgi:hypothetical protein